MAGHRDMESFRNMYAEMSPSVVRDSTNDQYTYKRIRPQELNIQHRKHVPQSLDEINSQEHDALVQKWAGSGLTIVSLLTENLLCHPFIVLRRQCQVHYSSLNYRLEPLSIVPITIRMLRRQQASSLWKGVGSVLIVRGMTLAVEDVVSKFSPLSKEWNVATLSSLGQHLLLKCLSLALTCPFYSASLVETVQSDIASERPGIFDVFRDGLCRILVWGSPQQGRMLPVWVLVVPTVVLGLLRYLVNILVHKVSYTVISDYNQRKHTRWGAIPKYSDSDSDTEVYAGFSALVVSDVLLYPFETVVHRLHLQGTRTIIDNLDTGYSVLPILTSYRGAIDCYHTIMGEEGRWGLYKGFGALILQFIAHAAVIRITKTIITHVTALLRSPARPTQTKPATPAVVQYTSSGPSTEQQAYYQPLSGAQWSASNVSSGEQFINPYVNSVPSTEQTYSSANQQSAYSRPPSSPEIRQRATQSSRSAAGYDSDEF
uniref:Solute carrier family 25 member 46 n=1 Tax=Cacopsylla melanoneura TaxID=428564 RepID=A0A8D8UWK1_9HEMI